MQKSKFDDVTLQYSLAYIYAGCQKVNDILP